jgi:hypothetical protein
MSRRVPLLDPLREAGGPCGLQRAHDGAWIAVNLLPAITSAARRTGLLGRDHLPEGEALLLATPSACGSPSTWSASAVRAAL